MKQEPDRSLVPRLRFPEFRDAEEWNLTPLGKVSTITSGGTPNRSNRDFWNGSIPWVTTSLIDFNTIYKTDECISKAGLKGSSAKLFPKNTILMAMYGQGKTRGKVAILGIEATTNQACAAILLDKDVDTNFLFQNLVGRYDEIRELSNRGGQENLSAGLIEQIHISCPTDKNEQQKIAECLGSIDDRITLETQKLAALRVHKKGLMQQLFPAEGQTLPQLRFPEFRDADEWEEKKLGEVCKIQRGKFSHRPRNEPKFFGGKYPFIQTGDVVNANGGAVRASQSLNELGLAVSKLFQPTIVLITIAANIGDTGILDHEACFTDSVVGLLPNDKTSVYFLELVMRGRKNYLNKIAPQAAQKNINNEILQGVDILIPQFSEQQKISDCLSSLDELITLQAQTIDALKLHKEGLMQQLFPSINEVSE
jgi:type I restriction enzyme, S subunit